MSNPKAPRSPRVVRPIAPDVAPPGKQCRASKKRKYNSRAAALRAGEQRYGNAVEEYTCRHCGFHHITRSGVPANDNDPQLDELVDIAIGARR